MTCCCFKGRKIKANVLISTPSEQEENHYRNCASSTPPRMWILEDSFWNSKSQQWRERLWSGRNTVGWMWAKADPTIIQFLLNIAGFTNLGGVPASLLLQRWLIYFKPIDYILRQLPCRHLKFFSFNPNGAEGNQTDSGKKCNKSANKWSSFITKHLFIV